MTGRVRDFLLSCAWQKTETEDDAKNNKMVIENLFMRMSKLF